MNGLFLEFSRIHILVILSIPPPPGCLKLNLQRIQTITALHCTALHWVAVLKEMGGGIERIGVVVLRERAGGGGFKEITLPFIRSGVLTQDHWLMGGQCPRYTQTDT